MALNQVATDRERKKSEQRLDHLNRVLKAIRKVNRLMVAETDPGRLIEGASAALTATLGYYNAWIALMDHDGQAVKMTACSGFPDGFRGNAPAAPSR